MLLASDGDSPLESPPVHPRHLLHRYGLHPKKGLGQSFLVDEGAVLRVIAAADLEPSDVVIEIGPGLGALTRHLAPLVQRVVAVEIDERLMPVLRDQMRGAGNVDLVLGDILDHDPAALVGAGPYKVVANLPYYITGAILRHLLSTAPRPAQMVLTVQLEVAQRLAAEPGQMSLLAVSVQFYGRVRQMARLKAGSFFPRPEVESAVVRVDLAAEPTVAVADEALFFRLVKAGFSQRRKQLHNSLRAGLSGLNDTQVALEAVGIDPRRRAETLGLEEWARLTNWISERQNSVGARPGD